MKKLLLTLYIVTFSFANVKHIETLQQEFQKNVIELNIYQKRYGSYIKNNCDIDITCTKEVISLLKSWDTVKNDKSLKFLLNRKKDKIKYDEQYWSKINYKLKEKKVTPEKSEFVSVVDLEKQLYIVTFWDNQSKKFHFIGQDFISSGNIQREAEIVWGDDHYLKTPSGIFKSTKQGWRSDGKVSEDNVTLGYGEKDSYVFYFGKQETIRYNTFDRNGTKIYEKDKWKLITDKLDFALHSHKSSAPMGEPNSHGCIRMTEELNKFVDNNLILHKNLFEDKKWLHRYSKAPRQPKNYNFAGEYLIVFDKI
ncbi:MAG: L,D-transpeptidase [Campylobacterota bacterium]|nr:L,D-transpeptidase [Campylobacterota bacterium]